MKYFLTFIFILLTIFFAGAQKLPAIQKTFLRAPLNLRIDGKSTEWGGVFQAYNPNIQAFYTLANDDDNLYLLLKATNPGIITKILWGGVTLSVSSLENNLSITFPKSYNEGLRMALGMTSDVYDRQTGTSRSGKQQDSIMLAINRKAIDNLKEITLTGLNGMPDTVISVYNDLGITCRSLLNEKANYIYELAIPLKYLRLSANGTKQFKYDIKINGLVSKSLRFKVNPNAIIGSRESGGIDLKAASATTYCSGQYVLVEKK